jgi:hypothetical protein
VLVWGSPWIAVKTCGNVGGLLAPQKLLELGRETSYVLIRALRQSAPDIRVCRLLEVGLRKDQILAIVETPQPRIDGRARARTDSATSRLNASTSGPQSAFDRFGCWKLGCPVSVGAVVTPGA